MINEQPDTGPRTRGPTRLSQCFMTDAEPLCPFTNFQRIFVHDIYFVDLLQFVIQIILIYIMYWCTLWATGAGNKARVVVWDDG